MGTLGCVVACGDRVQGPPERTQHAPAVSCGSGQNNGYLPYFWHAGRWYSELFEIASDQNGFITTDDVRDIGGSPQVLVDMHRYGHLERAAHGLYRFRSFPAGPLDELMQATLWPTEAWRHLPPLGARPLGPVRRQSSQDPRDGAEGGTCPTRGATRLRGARARPRLIRHHRFEGIRVVTPGRAILGGIERHLDQRLIGRAIDAARRRGQITRDEIASLERAG